MLNLARTSLKTLLGLAIRAEINSQKAYRQLQRHLKNPLLQEKVGLLALEEKKHEKALKNLFKASFPHDELIIPDKTEESLLPSIIIKPSSTLVDLLEQALLFEKAASSFYARLSRRVKGDKKRLLQYLSRVEKSHALMIGSEYALALQYEDYAEKGIDKVIT
ncbi:MAG: ferritin family protein [Candidatus Aminicenantes bacterium]|nr:ferritin family protein [Candidatus Aminicenantes bacterium]